MSTDKAHNFLNSLSIDSQIVELQGKLDILNGFKSRFQGSSVEWNTGATFVRDDFLEAHAKDISEAQIDLDSWPINCIDWEKAANELRQKYESIIFKGTQYWYIK
jgi:hypothetical protein